MEKLIEWLDANIEEMKKIKELSRITVNGTEFMNVDFEVLRTISIFTLDSFNILAGALGIAPTVSIDKGSDGETYETHFFFYKDVRIMHLEVR